MKTLNQLDNVYLGGDIYHDDDYITIVLQRDIVWRVVESMLQYLQHDAGEVYRLGLSGNLTRRDQYGTKLPND